MNAAREEAARAGHAAVSVQLQRGTWTVRLDTLTAPDHTVRDDDARALAGAVRVLVRAGVASSGTHGRWQYSLAHVAAEADARALAAAMHEAGDTAALHALSARLCAMAKAPGDFFGGIRGHQSPTSA